MKIRILSSLAILVIACNAMAFTVEMRTPRLQMPEAADAKQISSVKRLRGMMKRELTFIRGATGLQFWIQEFGGNAENVFRFIELLKMSKLWDLTIEFRAFDKGNSAFSISHHAEGNRMRVVINPTQKNFSRKRFSGLLKVDEGDATK